MRRRSTADGRASRWRRDQPARQAPAIECRARSVRALAAGPTAFVVDDERRLMRWEIGDGVLSGGSLGGAAQVLGVTVSREFGIDPYFVRFTPLTLTGAATTASSAEVYVNGQLVAREAIAPGAFTLRGLLAPVGAGRAEVVLRDAFGREQRLTSSFYQPVTLLRPGLHQFRYGVGARRDDEAAFLQIERGSVSRLRGGWRSSHRREGVVDDGRPRRDHRSARRRRTGSGAARADWRTRRDARGQPRRSGRNGRRGGAWLVVARPRRECGRDDARGDGGVSIGGRVAVVAGDQA